MNGVGNRASVNSATRSLSTMNGTPVFRAAWATVANCSALRKPSAPTSMRAPRLSTGFSLACRRGSDTGTELEAALAFTALDVSAFGAAAAVLARGVLAGAVATAGGVAFVAVASVDGNRHARIVSLDSVSNRRTDRDANGERT